MAAPKPHLVLAFDVETTGERLPVCPLGLHLTEPRGDALISVGWAGGRLSLEKRLEILVEPDRLDIDLRKPPETSWKDYWAEMGWSEETFRGFWSGRLRTLDEMQAKTVSLALAAHSLNRELAALEQQYTVTPLVDSIYDVVWINVLLNAQDYRGLDFTRTGRPRRVIEAYSFRLGLAALDHRDAASGHENGSLAAKAAFQTQREAFEAEYEHPHLPDRDAKGILAAYLSSLELASRQKT